MIRLLETGAPATFSLLRLFTFVFSLFALVIFSGCQPKEVTSAKIYMRNNDWDRAIAQLQQAVNAYPNNAEARFLLGQAYGHRERFKEMVKELDVSLKISNKFLQQITAERERYWVDKYNAAIVALDKSDFEAVESHLLTAILIDNSKQEAYKKLATTYYITDSAEKALAIYNKLLEKDPSNVDLLSSISNIYYTSERYQEAISLLKRMLEIEPGHRDALANLALSYDALGRQDEAAHAFEVAITANPQDVDLIFMFGEHHYKAGNFQRAIQLFEQVLVQHPEDFEATANLGNAYLSMAEYLRRELQSTISMNPDSMAPVEIQQLKSGAIANYKQAIPYLEKALTIEPERANLWRNLGVAYVNSGQKKRGEEAFLKAEELLMKVSK